MARSSRPHLRLVPEPPADPMMTIDCDQCVMQHTDTCDDCVVSYLVDHDASTPVVFGPDEQAAVALLADAGLVPPSQFTPKHGVA